MSHFDASHPNWYLMCDGGSCTNVYGISELYVELENLHSAASRDGWKSAGADDYFCPECRSS